MKIQLQPPVRMPSPSLPAFLAVLLFGLGLALPAGADPATPGETKRDVVSSRLVLPYYEVDMEDPSGTTTLFAVRNESTVDITVDVSFYEVDSPQAPQVVLESIFLDPKEVFLRNIRDVANLEVDADGFARGYVIIEDTSGMARLSGDYIFLTPGEDFATANQLVNATPDSPLDEVCSVFSVRWFRGAFGAVSQITLWLDTDTLPDDPQAVTYIVYDDDGDVVIVNNLPIEVVSTRVTVSDLLGPQDAGGGAVEFQLAEGLEGHVSVSIEALDRFSASFEGFCKD